MDKQNQSKKNTVRNLVIFTFFVLAFSWVGRYLDTILGSEPSKGIGITLWLISPLVISFLLRGFAGDGWKDLGIKPVITGNVLWYAVGILVYPICVLLIFLIGKVAGTISFPGFSSETVTVFIQTMVFIIGMSFIKNIFEEFAWRGYLAPKMYSLGINIFVAHALVGVIWGAWHLPYLAFVTGYLKESSSFLIPCFLLGTIAVSIVYGEIRLITNSVWSAVLMHTIGGAFVGALFMKNIFAIKTGTEFLFSPGIEGILTIVLFTVTGIGLHLLRKKRIRVVSTQP